MKKIGMIIFIAAAAVQLASAGLVLEETFIADYNAGVGDATDYTANIDGGNYGTGFSAGWLNNGTANPFHYVNITSHSGGAMTRGGHTSNTGGNGLGRTFNQAALTANGATVWFAVDVELNSTSTAGFALGSAMFADATAPTQVAGEQAIGFKLSNGKLSAATWDGTTVKKTESLNVLNITDTGLSEADNMAYTIIGKIQYGATATDTDTVSIWAKAYNGTETSLTQLEELTRSAVLDNTAFNTLTLQDNKAALWDNIRFATGGTDAEDLTAVLGGSVMTIPEPATLGLIGAFGGALLFIRRRFAI